MESHPVRLEDSLIIWISRSKRSDVLDFLQRDSLQGIGISETSTSRLDREFLTVNFTPFSSEGLTLQTN